MIGIEVWAIIGFVLAAYAVVGNDALQTLGTFINSNRQLHWTILFAFAALVLVATFAYGWYVNGGDPSYGRLSNTTKYPVIDIEWYHVLPPAVLVIITRLGIPVSTSFMVLTIFATLGGLTSMIEKSLLGYGLAFVVGAGVFLVLSRTLESWFERHDLGDFTPFGMMVIIGGLFFAAQHYVISFDGEPMIGFEQMLIGIGIVAALELIGIVLAMRGDRGLYWVTAQWATTAYLWSIWLVQDFANIFVFLPRELTAGQGFSAMAVIVVLLAVTFANRGGPVQRILRTKTNVVDIRSATIIDFTYASLLFYFKELNNIPMSTTWVFLGLIAGREYAFALTRHAVSLARAVVDTAEDVAKAFIGIVISIDLAVGLPIIGRVMSGGEANLDEVFSSTGFTAFVMIANLALIPIVHFAFSRPENHPNRATVIWGVGIVGLLVALAAAMFAFPIEG
jgi:hypothetical protein